MKQYQKFLLLIGIGLLIGLFSAGFINSCTKKPVISTDIYTDSISMYKSQNLLLQQIIQKLDSGITIYKIKIEKLNINSKYIQTQYELYIHNMLDTNLVSNDSIINYIHFKITNYKYN